MTKQPKASPPHIPIRGLRLGEAGDPVVLIMFDFAYERTRFTPDFWARFAGHPTLVLLLRSWEIRTVHSLASWPQKFAAHRREFPEHRIVYLTNEPGDQAVLEAAGMGHFFCNHNAFVDEKTYCPPEGARGGDAREFDAIYDARIAPFKRHPLAARVPRLALVHYDLPHERHTRWMLGVRLRLWRAKSLNKRKGLWPLWMSRQDVAACYRRAKVGLCLSEVEGAMLASIQYLLSGLPVVTTPSRGGRDQFFDSENSITVEPNARAVADAVQTLIERQLDPWAIRARALERMAEHQERLRTYIAEYQAEHGVPLERRLTPDWSRRASDIFNTAID